MAAVSPFDCTIETEKLTHEIFSILENKFLFGHSHGLPGLSSPPCEVKPGKNVAGKVRILSIDGSGSTDGVLAAASVARLESFLRKKTANPNACVADYFDLVAGSGVGGVIAALLFTRGKDGRPIYTADKAVKYVLDAGPKLFATSKPGLFRKIFWSPSKAKKAFSKIFGELRLKDTLKPILIPCYDLATGSPFVFSRADAVEIDGYDFKMKDVCAATSAGEHEPVEIVSEDRGTRIAAVGGAIAMNNPTAAAITHVLNNKQEFPFCNEVDDLLVVSLGNGEMQCGVGDRTPSRSAFVNIVGNGFSDMVDQAVSMAFSRSRGGNYVRVQASTDFSCWSEGAKGREEISRAAEELLGRKGVESVLFQGRKLLQSTNLEKLEFAAGEAVKENERRKRSVLPTVVFKQASPSPRTSSATTLSSSSSN